MRQHLPLPHAPATLSRLADVEVKRRLPRTLFLPCMGEYGCFVMSHIRQVHAWPDYKVVCCRPGEELYFPNADKFEYDWHAALADRDRRGMAEGIADDPAFRAMADRLSAKHSARAVYTRLDASPETLSRKFELKPKIVRDLRVDVVLAPRKRELCPERNFPRWNDIATAISENGYTIGVIGRRETSVHLDKAAIASWRYPGEDAAIELMKNCKLYIGTDTGPTHLASFLNVPTIAFGNAGFMWAAQCATKGYWEEVVEGWDHPEDVVSAALAYLHAPAPRITISTPPWATAGFGGVVYINLDDRPDRRAHIEKELAHVGLMAEWFAALRGTPEDATGFVSQGQVGCILSHRAVVSEAARRRWPSVLILEDDAMFVPNFSRRIERAVRELRGQSGWDLFYLQDTEGLVYETFGHIKRIAGSWLTHAYAVNAPFYDRFLADISLAAKLPIDSQLFSHPDARKYATRDILALQRDTLGSDIVPKLRSFSTLE